MFSSYLNTFDLKIDSEHTLPYAFNGALDHLRNDFPHTMLNSLLPMSPALKSNIFGHEGKTSLASHMQFC